MGVRAPSGNGTLASGRSSVHGPQVPQEGPWKPPSQLESSGALSCGGEPVPQSAEQLDARSALEPCGPLTWGGCSEAPSTVWLWSCLWLLGCEKGLGCLCPHP